MIFISFSSGFGGMLLQAQCGRRQMRHLLRGNFQSTGKNFTMKKVLKNFFVCPLLEQEDCLQILFLKGLFYLQDLPVPFFLFRNDFR